MLSFENTNYHGVVVTIRRPDSRTAPAISRINIQHDEARIWINDRRGNHTVQVQFTVDEMREMISALSHAIDLIEQGVVAQR